MALPPPDDRMWKDLAADLDVFLEQWPTYIDEITGNRAPSLPTRDIDEEPNVIALTLLRSTASSSGDGPPPWASLGANSFLPEAHLERLAEGAGAAAGDVARPVVVEKSHDGRYILHLRLPAMIDLLVLVVTADHRDAFAPVPFSDGGSVRFHRWGPRTALPIDLGPDPAVVKVFFFPDPPARPRVPFADLVEFLLQVEPRPILATCVFGDEHD